MQPGMQTDALPHLAPSAALGFCQREGSQKQKDMVALDVQLRNYKHRTANIWKFP